MGKKLNILYIHGFASTGKGSKVSYLKTLYAGDPSVNIISPDLPVDPDEALDYLCDIVTGIPDDEAIVTLGTSMGGLYALYINVECGVPAIVMNPLIDPKDSVRFIGENTNLNTGEKFMFLERHVQILHTIARRVYISPLKNTFFYLCSDDKILDYQKVLNILPLIGSGSFRVVTGGHRFENFESEWSGMKLIIDEYVSKNQANVKLCI